MTRNGSKVVTRSQQESDLPDFVHLRHGAEWYVRRLFPTEKRDARNRVKYIPIERRCFPETPERAAEIVKEIEAEYYSAAAAAASEAPPAGSVAAFLGRFLDSKKGNVAKKTYEDSFTHLLPDHWICCLRTRTELPDGGVL